MQLSQHPAAQIAIAGATGDITIDTCGAGRGARTAE